MARKSDLQRNIEGAKSRLESAKEGKYYDVASKTVKTHKDEKKKEKTIKTAEASLKSYDARNRSQTYKEGGPVVKAPKYKGAPLPPEVKRQKTSQERGLTTYQGVLDQPGGIKGVVKRAVKEIKKKIKGKKK